MSGRLCFFFAYTKCIGRTETQTRDRICFQTIRSVRDISRDDRARIATCSLRTTTHRFKANYIIDYYYSTSDNDDVDDDNFRYDDKYDDDDDDDDDGDDYDDDDDDVAND